jgi:hypothetical protein
MRIIITTLLFFPISLLAQLEFHRSNAIHVSENGDILDFAWAGGINSSQWSNIDLNNDGTDDIFIYERTSRTFTTYLADPSTQTYYLTFEYQNSFPPVRDWVLLRDFNCDGKNDIFTYTPGGIAVYENTSAGSSVSFSLRSPILKSYYDFGASEYYASIYMSNVDIPSIDDFDGDGDLDIHTFTLAGQTVEYHENHASDIGNCDSLAFVLANRCYGMFGEDAISPNLYIGQAYLDGGFCTFNVPNPTEAPRSAESGAHSGSSLCAFDYDHNGQKDLLVGDITSTNMTLVYIEDRGLLPDSAIAKEVGFPQSDIPIEMIVFNAGFYMDADMDGTKDLIVTPGNAAESEDLNSAWFYKNIGTTDAPVFNRQSRKHFQGEMIDMGTGAFPRFVDVNADGREDLVISNRGEFQSDGTFSEGIRAYIQTGPLDAPVLELLSMDFQSISSLAFGGHIAPTFGDLDGDGDMDMILGDGDGELHYFENIANAGQAMQFGTFITLQANGNNMDIGANLIPQLFDLNQDGLLDLIVGERNGNINYLQNQGTSSSFDMVLMEDSIGDITTDLDGNLVGYSAPWLFLNSSGGISALLGTEHGDIYYIEEVNPDPSSAWIITDSSAFGVKNGLRSCPTLYDFNNDLLLDLFNGDLSGGLGLYMGGPPPSGIDERENISYFQLYPNPSNGMVQINMPMPFHSILNIQIFDMTGRSVYEDQIKNSSVALDLNALRPGTYLISLTNDSFQGIQKFIKE